MSTNLRAYFHVEGLNGLDASFAIDDCLLVRGSINKRDAGLVKYWRSRPAAPR